MSEVFHVRSGLLRLPYGKVINGISLLCDAEVEGWNFGCR
jgi:hypothetical protein